MKPIFIFSISLLSICLMTSCDSMEVKNDDETVILNKTDALVALSEDDTDTENPTPEQYNNTKGINANGTLITHFDCPDSRFFPPVDLKKWNQVPVVNGRFPSYAETMNGTSIHHYGEKKNSLIKPYSMVLPKLAYVKNQSTGKNNLVIVIQIVQTAQDTVVGYRYLTGGVGGSAFHDFHFLTDDEVKKEMSK